MTSFSKFLANPAKDFTCKDLVHPEFESCSAFIWSLLRSSCVETLKYIGPLILIPPIINFRNTTYSEWKEKMETYLKMSFVTSFCVTSAFAIHCFLIRTKLNNISPVFVSMAIAMATWMNHMPRNYANLQFLFANNLLVQTMLRMFDYQPIKIVRESRIFSTILFMVISGCIMGLMALITDKDVRYWYARDFSGKTPKRTSDDQINDKLVLLKGMIHKQIMSTLKVALLMSSIKIVSKSVGLLRESLLKFVVSFVQNFDYKLLGFFVLYGSSFQAFNFLFNELSTNTKKHEKSFLAGFLAGAAFYLSPRYFSFTYAFTTLIELLLKFSLNKLDQSSEITKFLKNIPWLRVLLCISIPTFSHWRAVSPWMVPNIMDKLMRVTGDDRLTVGAKNFAKYVLGM